MQKITIYRNGTPSSIILVKQSDGVIFEVAPNTTVEAYKGQHFTHTKFLGVQKQFRKLDINKIRTY
jgi:hypothetical protein